MRVFAETGGGAASGIEKGKCSWLDASEEFLALAAVSNISAPCVSESGAAATVAPSCKDAVPTAVASRIGTVPLSELASSAELIMASSFGTSSERVLFLGHAGSLHGPLFRGFVPLHSFAPHLYGPPGDDSGRSDGASVDVHVLELWPDCPHLLQTYFRFLSGCICTCA